MTFLAGFISGLLSFALLSWTCERIVKYHTRKQEDKELLELYKMTLENENE